MKDIPFDKYAKIIKVLPIFCVDVVVQNTRGDYLLLKRVNEPKRNQWWVIGGRVFKGETMEEAAIRKVREETGLRVKKIHPIGYFELINGTNPFGLPFEYHGVSVVFKTVIADRWRIHMDNQSTEFKFAKKLPADFRIRSFEASHRTRLRAQKPHKRCKGERSL